MTVLSLWNWLKPPQRQAAIGRRRRRRDDRTLRARGVPRLEALEDRTLPSTFTVLNLADSGPGSLRQAILDANATHHGPDTIRFADGLHGTITLTSGELAITHSLDVEGPGADQLTVSGNHASRVFDVSSGGGGTGGGARVTIAGMTITDGLANGNSPVLASTGGAILNFGSLTLSDDVLSDNQAVGDPHASAFGMLVGGAAGGALANLGSLSVSDTTFTRNQALGADGSSGNSAGTVHGGAIFTSGAASITDSRFTFNVAQAGSNCSGNLCATGVAPRSLTPAASPSSAAHSAITRPSAATTVPVRAGTAPALAAPSSAAVPQARPRRWWSAPARSTTIRPSAATGIKSCPCRPTLPAAPTKRSGAASMSPAGRPRLATARSSTTR